MPVIYGQEVAFNQAIPFSWDGVNISWNQNPGVTAEFKKVVKFRNSSVAIRCGDMLNYRHSKSAGILKSKKYYL